MKKFYAACCAVMICTMVSAKIWRVNNVPGVVADFTTIQTAHDNASVLPGDTIHLEPSTASYGNLTMTKRLTIISIGDFLAANAGVQYSQITGTMGTLTINNASASGSVFHCNIDGGVSIQSTTSLRFERCRMTSFLSFSNAHNNTILQNYLYYAGFSNSNNNIIANNIFSYYLSILSTASATVVNNIIYAVTPASNQQINNSSFQNNIINKNGSFVFTNTVVENNLISNANLPVGNGNMINVPMTNVFVNASGSTDADFKLQNSSPNPATGAGVGGVDCGAYGGANPFKPALQAAIPAIYKLTAPASPSGSTMNITFSTRSNN